MKRAYFLPMKCKLKKITECFISTKIHNNAWQTRAFIWVFYRYMCSAIYRSYMYNSLPSLGVKIYAKFRCNKIIVTENVKYRGIYIVINYLHNAWVCVHMYYM